METGKHFERNQKKLDSIADIDHQWAVALTKCTAHIRLRLKKKTSFGAHTAARLEGDPVDYYLSYAYKAILSGDWEWKDYSLSEQMIRIADSTISTEVEKMSTGKEKENKVKVIHRDDMDTLFFEQDPLPDELDMVREIVINKQISVIEEAIHGDDDLVNFWECVKEGMKRAEIASFMEKTPRQVDKLRERLVGKIKASPYFEM